MENNKNDKANEIIKNEIIIIERNSFAFRLIFATIVYAGITFWLNAIRASAPLWLVWFLIIVQFALYFSIFISSYRRAKVCGLNKNISICIFTTLAILGRVNDWEIVIIPLTIIIMLIFSMRAKNVSEDKKYLLPEQLKK